MTKPTEELKNLVAEHQLIELKRQVEFLVEKANNLNRMMELLPDSPRGDDAE